MNFINDWGRCGGVWFFMWVWSEGLLSFEFGVYVVFCY